MTVDAPTYDLYCRYPHQTSPQPCHVYLDAAHERLRKLGLVPFATSAVPPWAQVPLRDLVAGDVAQAFGMSGQRLAEFKQTGAAGERELRRQISGYRHPLRIVADYF